MISLLLLVGCAPDHRPRIMTIWSTEWNQAEQACADHGGVNHAEFLVDEGSLQIWKRSHAFCRDHSMVEAVAPEYDCGTRKDCWK